MSKTTERKTVISVPEEVKATQEYIEKYFPIVEASTLSLENEFLKHKPESKEQRRFKKALVTAIKSGLSDFRTQVMDPSFDENGDICYKAGMTPAVNKSAKWWNEKSKLFLPEKESRLGTNSERIAFLGLLIKYLIEEKEYSVSNAWRAVCDQSKELGHYRDSNDAKHEFEVTGSRQVGKWYDLGNAYKITTNDTKAYGFSLVGGNYNCYGDREPLADVVSMNDPDFKYFRSVGWLVLSV